MTALGANIGMAGMEIACEISHNMAIVGYQYLPPFPNFLMNGRCTPVTYL